MTEKIEAEVTPFSPLRPSQCAIGKRVVYHPSMNDLTGFEGTIASEPRDLCGTMVVRLEDMDPSYGEWRGTPERKSVPAAAVCCLTEVRHGA